MGIAAASSSARSSGLLSRLNSINLRPLPGLNNIDSPSQGDNFPAGNQSEKSSSSPSKNSSGQGIPSFGSANRFALIGGETGDRSGNGGSRASESGVESRPETSGNSSTRGPGQLSPEERRQVQRLKRIDAKVRAHEQAHLTAAGQFAQGGASFEFVTGPDGREYAVGGEVSLDTSKASNPEQTVQKMRQVKRAALAPANPSPQDMKIAAQASQKLAEAQQEMNQSSGQQSDGATQNVEGENGPESSEASPQGQPAVNESGNSMERPGDFGVNVSEQTQSFINNQQTSTRPQSSGSDFTSTPSSSPDETPVGQLFNSSAPSTVNPPGQFINFVA